MIKRYLLIFYLVISSFYASRAQTPYWMQQAKGSGNDEVLDIVAYQTSYYITGYYSNPTQFGSTLLQSQQGGDAFVAKINQNGEYDWAQKIGGVNTDRGIAISVMPNGNVVAAGHFVGTASCGNLSVTSISTSQDIYVACFAPTGNVLWLKRFGNQGIDIVSDIKTDGDNNIIFTGQFIGTLQMGNDILISGINYENGLPTYDIFISKLNSSGDVVWSKHGKSNKNNRSGKIEVGLDNSIFVSGNFNDTLILVNTYQNNSLNMGFIARFDMAGALMWFRRVQSSVTEIMDIAFKDSLLYMTGSFSGIQRFANDETINNWQNATPTPHEFKYYVAAYKLNGTLDFAITESSQSFVKPRAVKPLNNGGFSLAGEFRCQHTQYQLAYGSGLYISRGYKDLFISEFNAGRIRTMAKQIGGTGEDEVNAMVINSFGKPVIAGSFTNRISSPAKLSWGEKPWYNEFGSNGSTLSYCNDPEYDFYAVLKSEGSKDLLIANIFDENRSTMDIFKRQGGVCNQSVIPGTLNVFTENNNPCGIKRVRPIVSTANVLYNGIDYNFLWNNDTLQNIFTPSMSGMVTLNAQGANTCYSYSDSVNVNVIPPIPNATIQTVGATVYNIFPVIQCQSVIFAPPNSNIILTGNTAPPQFNTTWILPGGSTQTQNPLTFNNQLYGVYTYQITDPVSGCSKSSCIRILPIDSTGVVNGIGNNNNNLRFKHGDRILETGDTLKGCLNDTLSLQLVILGPDSVFIPAVFQVFGYWQSSNENVHVSYGPTLSNHTSLVTLNSDTLNNGSVNIGIAFSFGFADNAFGSFSDQFYISLYPQPVLDYTITGNLSPICPGDTARFQIVTPNYYSFDLDFSNVVESEDPLSFYTLFEQDYHITFRDTSDKGCIAKEDETFSMSYFQSPTILLQPANGIICIGQPVSLSIPGITNLTWIGPTGDTLSTDPVFYAELPGLYYAILNDANNCVLISNTANVRDRSSFGYELAPEAICPGQTANISLFALEGDNISWLPPLSGNQLNKVVNQPGIYRFTAPVCGVVDTFNVVVSGPLYTAQINLSADTTICEGDTITLSSLHQENVSLTWLNNSSSDPSIEVGNGGVFILKLIDQLTCESFDTVSITQILAPEPPLLPAFSSYCGENSIYLTSLSGDSLLWFLGNTIVSHSPDFTYLANQFNQTLYIANLAYDTGCKSEILEYPIDAKLRFQAPLSDTIYSICNGEEFNLSFSPSQFDAKSHRIYLTTSNGIWNLLSTDSVYTIPNVALSNAGLYQIVFEGDTSLYCSADTVKIFLIVKAVPNLSISSSDLYLCSDETVSFWTQGNPNIIQSYWTYSNAQFFQDTLYIVSSTISASSLIVEYNATLANGCTIELSSTFQVGTRPPITLYNQSLITLCSGETTLLTLPNNQTALWYMGNTQLTTQPVNSFYYVSTFNDPPITVFNTDINGICPSDPTTIPILVKPRVNIGQNFNTALCPGISGTVFYNPSNLVGMYYWKNMLADTIIATNQNSIVLPPVAGTYGLFAFPNQISCGQDSVIFNVTINPLPTLNVTPFPNDTICLNNGVLYSSSTSFVVSSSKLFLNQSNIPISICNSCATHEFLLSNATANGLQIGENILLTRVQTPGSCIVEHIDTIQVLTTPTPDFSGYNYSVCVGDTLLIQANVPGTYDWVETNSFSYLSDPLLGLTTPYNVYATQTNDVNFIVSNANPTLFVNSVDPITLCRSNFVEIPFQIKPDMNLPAFSNYGICENDSVAFSFSPSDELVGIYQWTLPNGQTSIDTSFVIHGNELDKMGQYQLIAYPNQLSCGNDTAIFSLESYSIPLVEFAIDSFQVCTNRDWIIQANITGDAQVLWNYNGLSSTSNPLTINLPNFTGDSLLISGVFTTSQGCVVNKFVSIAVYETPETPDLSVISTICAQDKIILSLNNFLSPDQQFHYQSNVNFTELGNQLLYNTLMQDTVIQFVSYIQSPHCTSDTLFNSYVVNPLPVFDLGNDSLLFCLGVGTQLEGPLGYTSYQWSTGETTPSISVTQTGIYELVVTDQQGCIFTSNIHVIGDWPLFQFDADSIEFCFGDKIELVAPAGFEQYQWNTGANQNFINVTETGQYILVITDKNGCTYSDTLFAQGGQCEVVSLPNVFTPNGDGYNDKFTLNPYGLVAYKMVIFNRWGNNLREVSSNEGGWDGKDRFGNEMTAGVYFFVAIVDYINKSSEELKGTIQLIKD